MDRCRASSTIVALLNNETWLKRKKLIFRWTVTNRYKLSLAISKLNIFKIQPKFTKRFKAS
jgi:hypothetical protein